MTCKVASPAGGATPIIPMILAGIRYPRGCGHHTRIGPQVCYDFLCLTRVPTSQNGPAMKDLVRYEAAGRIAQINIERPPVNALNLPVLEELIAALRRAAADDNIRAVVLTSGVPRRFSAGLDLNLVLGKSTTKVRVLLQKLYLELSEAQYHLGKPSIAAVAG